MYYIIYHILWHADIPRSCFYRFIRICSQNLWTDFTAQLFFRGLRKYGKAYTPKRRQKLLFFRIQKKLFKSTRCREKYAHAAEVFAQADLWKAGYFSAGDQAETGFFHRNDDNCWQFCESFGEDGRQSAAGRGPDIDVMLIITTKKHPANKKAGTAFLSTVPAVKWYPHQDSNLELILRRDPLYPV